MGWMKRAVPAPTVEDLTPLLGADWTGGKITVVRAAGGPVTIHANSLTRGEAATGSTSLVMLPPRLAPVEHLYGSTTFRGKRVRLLSNGALSIDDPNTSLDYFALTYIAKGGA